MAENGIAGDTDEGLNPTMWRHRFDQDTVKRRIRILRFHISDNFTVDNARIIHIDIQFHTSSIGFVGDLLRYDLHRQGAAHPGRDLFGLTRCGCKLGRRDGDAGGGQFALALDLGQGAGQRVHGAGARVDHGGPPVGIAAGQPAAIVDPAPQGLAHVAQRPHRRQPALGQGVIAIPLPFRHPDRHDRYVGLGLNGDQRLAVDDRVIAVIHRQRCQDQADIRIRCRRQQRIAISLGMRDRDRGRVDGIADGRVIRQAVRQALRRLGREGGQFQPPCPDIVGAKRRRPAGRSKDGDLFVARGQFARQQLRHVDQFVQVVHLDHAEVTEHGRVDLGRSGDRRGV